MLGVHLALLVTPVLVPHRRTRLADQVVEVEPQVMRELHRTAAREVTAVWAGAEEEEAEEPVLAGTAAKAATGAAALLL